MAPCYFNTAPVGVCGSEECGQQLLGAQLGASLLGEWRGAVRVFRCSSWALSVSNHRLKPLTVYIKPALEQEGTEANPRDQMRKLSERESAAEEGGEMLWCVFVL